MHFFVACSCADASWTNDTYSFFDSTNLAKYIHEPTILWKLTLWYGVATILYCLPWPLIGMVVSLLTKNKYIIIASPFVVFMAWNYLVQLLWRFFPKILWLLPTQPLLCSGLVGEPFWTLPLTIVYPILYHAVLIGGLMFVYLFTMQRRFRREGI